VLSAVHISGRYFVSLTNFALMRLQVRSVQASAMDSMFIYS